MSPSTLNRYDLKDTEALAVHHHSMFNWERATLDRLGRALQSLLVDTRLPGDMRAFIENVLAMPELEIHSLIEHHLKCSAWFSRALMDARRGPGRERDLDEAASVLSYIIAAMGATSAMNVDKDLSTVPRVMDVMKDVPRIQAEIAELKAGLDLESDQVEHAERRAALHALIWALDRDGTSTAPSLFLGPNATHRKGEVEDETLRARVERSMADAAEAQAQDRAERELENIRVRETGFYAYDQARPHVGPSIYDFIALVAPLQREHAVTRVTIVHRMVEKHGLDVSVVERAVASMIEAGGLREDDGLVWHERVSRKNVAMLVIPDEGL